MGLEPNAVNPVHAGFLRDETISDRRESGGEFGDSTVFSINGSLELLRKAFGPPEEMDLLSTIALPVNHPERQALDARLREVLTRVQEPASREPQFSITTAFRPDLTVRINFGLPGREPNYLMLVGNQGYRVTETGSERFLLRPDSDRIVFELTSETDAEFLRSLPPLKRLIEIQSLRGAALRSELGVFPTAVEAKLSDLMAVLLQIDSEAEPPQISIDVPDPNHPEHPVEARFTLDGECQVTRLELVR